MRNKNFGGMPPPRTRSEMEHNISLVIEDTHKKIESKEKDLIGSVATFTLPHLRKVKKTPNNRINLLTVNEQIRLQANMLEWMGKM